MDDLLAVQGMTAADLEENRRGRISSAQAESLRRRIGRLRLLVMVAMGLGLAAALIGGIASTAGNGKIAPLIGGCIGGGLYVVFLWWLLSKLVFGPMLRGVDGGVVSTVEGTVTRRFVSFSGRGYLLWLDGARYGGANSRLGRAVQKGDRLRLFVLPDRRAVIAVERI